MTIQLGVVMDDIASINYKKDSTLAMLWEAKQRGWDIWYLELQDIFLRDGIAYGTAKQLDVFHDDKKWFAFKQSKTLPLSALNVILMRKDPPFDEQYIYATYILEHAQDAGTLVVNHPQALRDANEKLFATWFPQCSPPAIVTKSQANLAAFWEEHHDIVCKPLNAMGGKSIFRLQNHDVNANVIFDTLTEGQSRYIMAQRFIPEIKAGDKRILMINGEPVPFVLARVPQGDDWRGNLAVGAKGVVQALSERERWICQQVGPELRKRGLYFVGLDVIGDYLTEINVTSPTCIREIDAGANINVAGILMDFVQSKL